MSRRKKRRAVFVECLEARRCLTASFGWDGPGQGSAELSYHIGQAPSGLSQGQYEQAIESALEAWSDVVDVTFTRTEVPNQRDAIDFRVRPIDGAGGTLAQAYLPDDVNPARIAGDVEFDAAETWEIGNDLGNRAFDLLHVAVHEIGHALGIEHLDHHDSVLAPFVNAAQSFTALSAHDIDAALALYAPADPAIEQPNEGLDHDSHSHEDHEHGEDVVDETTPAEEDASDEPQDTDSTSNQPRRYWRPWFGFFARWRGGWPWFRAGANATPAHNADNPADVDGDGEISSRDALSVLVHLVDPNATEGMMTDANGDGITSLADALVVINAMRQEAASDEMEGADIEDDENETADQPEDFDETEGPLDDHADESDDEPEPKIDDDPVIDEEDDDDDESEDDLDGSGEPDVAGGGTDEEEDDSEDEEDDLEEDLDEDNEDNEDNEVELDEYGCPLA